MRKRTFLLGAGITALLTSGAFAQPAAPEAAPVIPSWDPVTQERLDNPAPGEWPFYRRTYDGWGYSPLDQVNASNVSQLQPVWSFATGSDSGHESPGMVVNGVMVTTQATATWNQVLANDAATGKGLWRYEREMPADMIGSHSTNRGAGFWDDKVFFMSRDSVLVALDAQTGEEVWSTATEDYHVGYYANLAPLVVDGKVMVGSSGGERGIRGYVAAYDAASGEEVWRSFMVPAPGEPGSETWLEEGDWEHGGASTWITGSYDSDNDLIYWGTGNGGPWMGDQRPGDNLYVTSVVSLDPDNGQIQGYFQYLHNESWDWDEVAAPILVDLPDGSGGMTPGLVHAARSGLLWQLSRSDAGEIAFLRAEPYVYADWIDNIDSQSGRVTYAAGSKPGTGVTGEFCPSFWGGKDWPPIAYSPDTNYVYIPAQENLCSAMRGGPIEYIPGAGYTRGGGDQFSQVLMQEGADHVGEVQAWDLATGERVWTHEFANSANWGPLMATGGGLVFGGGTADQTFRAFDAESGDVLWEANYLPSSVIGVPSTYEIDGKQYVAVQSGWGIDARGMQSRLTQADPNRFWNRDLMPTGGSIWVFALP